MHSKLYVRLMNSAQWRKARQEWLGQHPLCQRCLAEGRVEASRCVHHVVPVESGRTDAECERLAFSRANLQALCYRCHAEVHSAERSHSREAHCARAAERLRRWADRHESLRKKGGRA